MAKPPTLTRAEARKATRWFQKRLGIQDWTIKLDVQDDVPRWGRDDADDGTLGMTMTFAPYKEATIWIAPGRHAKGGDWPLATLLHELLHVVAHDTGVESGECPPTEAQEYVHNRIGDLLAAAYRKGL